MPQTLAFGCLVFLTDSLTNSIIFSNCVSGKRPRRRWEDNIKMDLQKVGRGGDWMELAQDRDRCRALVNTVMNLRVP